MHNNLASPIFASSSSPSLGWDVPPLPPPPAPSPLRMDPFTSRGSPSFPRGNCTHLSKLIVCSVWKRRRLVPPGVPSGNWRCNSWHSCTRTLIKRSRRRAGEEDGERRLRGGNLCSLILAHMADFCPSRSSCLNTMLSVPRVTHDLDSCPSCCSSSSSSVP